mmetsp:Transcript_22427/g.38326  ORF Transcript_22427/g.38326 Transcript_22427/m.38326 type:complete len:263 (-) Transcript_22427:655-1443(-)
MAMRRGRGGAQDQHLARAAGVGASVASHKRLCIPECAERQRSTISASARDHPSDIGSDVLGRDLELRAGLVGAGREDLAAHDVRVAVGRRAAVLEVAAALSVGLARDADRAAAVGDAVRELVDRGGLVRAGQATLVALAVGRDVLGVLRAEALDRGDDLGEAARIAHLLRGEVGVAAGTVPVARDGLRVERAVDVEVLAHALQDVARHPQLVTRRDAGGRADLVLPLAGHHLSVGARDREAGVQARLVVRLRHGAAERVLGA